MISCVRAGREYFPRALIIGLESLASQAAVAGRLVGEISNR